ncbi:MAG: NAD(P)/FAD-dependent oxidoreductase [Schleiferiaceae bacterium]|nr:NAD(P)/FAD-dependent oxidoreductase [Schleiferiaceae bacterium]MDR9441752.1 NAD(P)/FAD-dependent oxidoreductase [Schleiferiaceae bacterium]
MSSSRYDAIIIGAGAAGLTAARYLQDYKLNTLVLEKGDRVGGRLRTDEFRGYRMDHGFQVLLTAYPMAQKYLDLEALKLHYFEAGAICFNQSRKFTVKDTMRHPKALPMMALSPVGSLMDKIRLGNLRARVQQKSLEDIFNGPETSTQEYLKALGFSDRIIERFFRPFYSGIFLEPHLETSSRMFEFVFKMMSEGGVAIPERGMESIAHQLKEQLVKTDFRFQTEVKRVEPQQVELKNGEVLHAQQIIMACDAPALLPQMEQGIGWTSTTQFYFAAEKSPFGKPLIALAYGDNPLINSLAVLSDVAASYAPAHRSILQVTLHERPQQAEEEVIRQIRTELTPLLGAQVEEWEFLRSFQVKKALPKLTDLQNEVPFEQTRVMDGLYQAGDHLLNPSLNGAMQSGELAARALVLNHINE